MFLNIYEREILKKINLKEIATIVDLLIYLNQKYELQSDVNKDDYTPYMRLNDKYYIVDNKQAEKMVNDIRSIYSLCETLSRNGMLNFIGISPLERSPIYMLIDNYHRIIPPDLLVLTIKENYEKRIIVNEKLDVFIRNNYKTIEEMYMEDEKKQRKRAETRMTIIAIVSILASVITTILGYITYSNEREVYIKNESIIEKPLPIIIDNLDELENIIKKHIQNIEKEQSPRAMDGAE